MSDKTCLDLMVGLGNKYPKTTAQQCRPQSTVLRFDRQVASPKRIVKALEAMKHQKGMKKGFSLGMSEVDHKATLWVRDLSQVIVHGTVTG
jgi:hypothetical protein